MLLVPAILISANGHCFPAFHYSLSRPPAELPVAIGTGDQLSRFNRHCRERQGNGHDERAVVPVSDLLWTFEAGG